MLYWRPKVKLKHQLLCGTVSHNTFAYFPESLVESELVLEGDDFDDDDFEL